MEMSHQLVVICWMIWIIILAHQVAGRSTGPPSAACADITPEHSPDLPSTCTPPCPYSLQVTAINGVSVGPLTGSVEYSSSSDMFRIEVIASGANIFKGFAIQSRTTTDAFDTNAAFQGSFANVDGDALWQLIACTESSNATAGHTSNVDKSQVTFYWIPPSIPDNVTLWFTIVVEYATFHVQMEGLRMIPSSTIPSTTTIIQPTSVSFDDTNTTELPVSNSVSIEPTIVSSSPIASVSDVSSTISMVSISSSITSIVVLPTTTPDVVDANSVSGRQYFAFGEEIVLMCNTIPPNISVTWEVQRDGEFEPVNDALVHYEPSSSLRTVLRFTASLVTLGNSYQCRGTGLLINEVSSSVFITIIPDVLTIQLYGPSIGEMYLVNRSAVVVPLNFNFICLGILENNGAEIISESINTTVGFYNIYYNVSRRQYDISATAVTIYFTTFLSSHSGSYTCHSRATSAEIPVFLSSTTIAVLISPNIVRVMAGEDAVFVYRIALIGDVDVLENVQVFINNFNDSSDNVSIIVDQGNDIYHVIFPQVDVALDQAEFVLQYNGTIITNIARVAVLASNIIVSPERFAVNSVGDDVLLSCTPNNSTISIIWYKGSELLTTSTKYTFTPAELQHNLTINNAQHNDSGSYYCVFAGSEIREDLQFVVIIIQDPIAMTLNGVTLPPVAVLNNPGIPSSLVVMCIGTESNRQLELRSSSDLLPNPVVAGVYQSDNTIFNALSYDNAIVLNISRINGLPLVDISFNCTSLQSSAAAKLFVSSRSLVVASLEDNIEVYYSQPFTILYTVATFSNGTDNLDNNTVPDLTVEFTSFDSVEPITLDPRLVTVEFGNLYRLTVPFASLNTSGTYTLTAQLFFGEITSSATIEVTTILPEISTTTAAVYQLQGDAVRLDCNLSFPGSSLIPIIPITWYHFNGENYTDVSYIVNVVFIPPELATSLLLESVSVNDTGSYVCTIEEDGVRIVEASVDLFVFQEEVNVGYDSNSLLPSGTIINNIGFVIIGSGSEITPPPRRRNTKWKRNAVPYDNVLSLNCMTVPGQEYPHWELSNNQFFNGTLTNNFSVPLQEGELEATIFITSFSKYITEISFDIFDDPLNGIYTCRSSSNGPSSSVEITTRNPVVRAVTQSPLIVPQCQTATLIFQLAQSSDGLYNSVDVVFSEQFRNGMSFRNHTLLPLMLSVQLFQINFTVSSVEEGDYYFYLPTNPSENELIEVQILYPALSLIGDDSITILRGDDVTFECIPSDLSLPVQWRFYNTEGIDMVIGPGGDVNGTRVGLNKRQAEVSNFVFEVTPPGLFHQITLFNVPLTANGRISCEIVAVCSDPLVIAQNISLNVLPACEGTVEVAVWPKTPVSTIAMIRCAEIHSLFWFGPFVTRRCNEGEIWDEPDTSSCTVRSGSMPLLVASVRLGRLYESEEIPNPLEIQELALDYFDSNEGITVRVDMFEDNRGEFPVTIVIELPPGPANSTDVLDIQNYLNDFGPYGSFSAVVPPLIVVFEPNDTCFCNNSFTVIITDDGNNEDVLHELFYFLLDVCIGPALPPCVCNTSTCRCNDPAYTGNGSLCGRDSDGDTLPDVGLDCDGLVCEKDVCPLMYSISQDGTSQNGSVCMATIDQGQPSCPEDTDDFSLTWLSTAANRNISLPCPRGFGTAYRYCNSSGDWQPPIVRECISYEYVAITLQAQTLRTVQLQPEQIAEMSIDIVSNLVTITEPVEDTSALPLDLGATVEVLSTVISLANMSGVLEDEEFVNDVLLVYNNVLNISNTPGWTDLQEVNRTQSQMLLQSAEQFSLQLANTIDVSENRTIAADNIVITVQAVDVSNNDSIPNVMWPTPDVLEEASIFKGSAPSTSVIIPSSLIQQRGISSENGVVLIAITAYQNFDNVLPPSVNISSNGDAVIQSVSLLLSSQVDVIGSSTSVQPSIEDPVVLMFDYSTVNIEDFSELRCGFWNFSLEQGSGVPPGGWSSIGLSIENSTNTTITCTSTHLTSFAVLVDVSGASQKVSKTQRKALSIVSYIGCAISLLCLIAAIILFIIYRNTLLKGIHNFIHLNLAIALALALLVFVTGIETVTDSDAACTVVAALLHYFFTCVFTWMLCEGIMLYFLLVKVFNIGVGRNKWFYLAIGWGTPLPIVAISVGIAHDQYGNDDYCWISTDEGAIWAFVAPMLVIILANVGLLALAMYAVYKSKMQSLSAEEMSNVDVAKTLLKATVVLLPLLGITWVFGILAVNEESVAFAWIFTILNSLQGVFIFAFHVLRNEKIKERIKSYIRADKSKYPVSSTRTTTTTRGGISRNDYDKVVTVKMSSKFDDASKCDDESKFDDEMELRATKRTSKIAEYNVYINPLADEESAVADNLYANKYRESKVI